MKYLRKLIFLVRELYLFALFYAVHVIILSTLHAIAASTGLVTFPRWEAIFFTSLGIAIGSKIAGRLWNASEDDDRTPNDSQEQQSEYESQNRT